jgi:hypothetical protein
MELVRGTVRQISGEAARRQPERYRLNTPIATIGVRGTDFLARASSAKLETYVHEGMIVLLPPAEQCRADCPILASSSAADAGRYVRILSGGTVERTYVAPEDVERLFGIRAATSRDRDTRDGFGSRTAAAGATPTSGANGLPVIMPLIFADPQGGNGVRLADARPSAGATANASGGTSGSSSIGASGTSGASVVGSSSGNGASTSSTAGSSSGTTAGTGAGSIGTSTSGTPSLPATPVFVAPEVALVPLPTTLVWGRFSEPLQIPVTLTLSYDEARQGRHVTVGELSQYALWRDDPRGTLMPALTGQATFSLAAGQAFYRTNSATEVATISSARLTADFDLARFSTELSLKSANGGSIVLSATGRINDEGVFLSLASDGSQRVAGAFSRSGTEAGYLFNKVAGGGLFQGITLWRLRK